LGAIDINWLFAYRCTINTHAVEVYRVRLVGRLGAGAPPLKRAEWQSSRPRPRLADANVRLPFQV